MNDTKKPSAILIRLDAKSQFFMLTEKEAGQVIRALLEYADTGELLPIKSRPANITFESLKAAVDSYNEMYVTRCEKNRAAIEARWKRKKEAEEKAKAIIEAQTDTNVYERIQSNKSYSNATDNDNVKEDEYEKEKDVIVAKATDNKKEKENRIKEKEKSKAFLDEYFAKDIFIDGLCKELRSTPAELKTLAEGIIVEWNAAGETHSDYTDAHKHLTSTLRIKSRESKRVNSNNDNRPPKPSVHHVWSDALQEWVYAF